MDLVPPHPQPEQCQQTNAKKFLPAKRWKKQHTLVGRGSPWALESWAPFTQQGAIKQESAASVKPVVVSMARARPLW